MILTLLTFFHVVISLIAIASGFVVVFGLLQGRRSESWTKWFLVTTVATSVTGFFFPVQHFLPSHGVGIISLLILSVAIYARYARRMNGFWAKTYAVTAVVAFYLNVFVAVVQSFLKIPALKALAPTQSEPPFKITQLIVFVLFFGIGIVAARRASSQSTHAN